METVPLSVQVSPALRDDVDQLAAALGRDRAWVIEHAVRQYVEAESHFRHAVEQGLAEIDRGDYVTWETMKQDLAQIIAIAPE